MKLAIILAVAFLLVGCSEPSQTTAPSDSQTNEAPSAITPTTPAPKVPSAQPETPVVPPKNDKIEPLLIANWNLQRFGDTKGSDAVLLTEYSDILSNFDIAFIQEVQSEEAFDELCLYMGDDYECELSIPAGTSYKEQYGVFYKPEVVTIEAFLDLEEQGVGMDGEQLWMRPPIVVTFNASGYIFTVWNIHIKPDDAEYEIGNLYSNVIAEEGNVIVMGDFNADCSYFKPEETDLFEGWYWAIGDDEDTTSGNSDCSYDRIIANEDAANEITDSGVLREGITEYQSDHYPVWVEITP